MPRPCRSLLALAVLLAVACSGGGEPPAPAPAPAAPAADAPSSAAAEPAPAAPIAPLTSHDGMGAEPTTIAAPGILLHLPGAWVREEPDSQMRLAQAKIPGPGGDAELAVFFFGEGGGGAVEANLDRWIGQVHQPEGAAPRRDRFTVGDFQVTWVQVKGTLKASSTGMGPSQPQFHAALFGAVVEGPGGPWFFKATGPDQTLSEARQTFVAMLRTARPKAG